MKKSLLASVTLSFGLFLIAHSALAADPWPANPTPTELIPGSLATFNAGFEASGVAYLSGYGFIINGDDGDIAVVNSAGTTLLEYWAPTGDLEDVTITDTTAVDHKVYLANEATNQIEEFNLTTGTKTGLTWTLSDLPISGGSGFEALAFVPAAYAPAGWGTALSGGFFIAGSQAEANIRVYTFSRAASASVTSLLQIPVSYADVSALHYNTSTRLLYVMFDTDNKMKEYSLAGTIVNSYVLPTAGSEEGVVIIPNCSSGTAQIVIANDGTANSVSSYSNYPIQCDIDGDGVVYSSDCNDSNAAISVNQTYYRDIDGDGLGTSATTTSVCSLTVPAGYSSNSTDVNDNDADNDGYTGSTWSGSDCNDSDATISVNQTYYRDFDGDGLGTSATTTSVCSLTAPTGYVTNSTDTDDSGIVYTTYDPLDKPLYAATITKISGVRHGKIKIHFSDGTRDTYRIFSSTTKRKTQVKSVKKTGYILVTAQHKRRIALVNVYTGAILDSVRLARVPKNITVNLAKLSIRIQRYKKLLL